MFKTVLGTLAFVFAAFSSFMLSRSAYADGVLYIGDSHSDATFGRTLDSLIRGRNSHLATYAFGGSIPDWYLNETKSPWGSSIRGWDGVEHRFNPQPVPRIDDLIEKYQPELVIVALGTNFLREGDPATSSVELAEKIIKRGIQCVWIGPPQEARVYETRINDFDLRLSQALSRTPCRYISSLPFTQYPEGLGDGIHYDTAGPVGAERAVNWAKNVFKALESSL